MGSVWIWVFLQLVFAQPSECGRQRTLIILHGHTVSQLQGNGNLAVWMSQISTKWRECSILALSTIQWVPVQGKESKILCVKLEAMKITQIDSLHQENLTINLGSNSDWLQLQLPLTHSLSYSLSHLHTICILRMQEQEQYAANLRFRHCCN